MAGKNIGQFFAHMSAMVEFKNALPSIEAVKEREEKFIRYTNELRALNSRQSVNLPSGCDTREEYAAFLSKELFFLQDQLETRLDMFEAWSDYIADLLDCGPGDGDLPSWDDMPPGFKEAVLQATELTVRIPDANWFGFRLVWVNPGEVITIGKSEPANKTNEIVPEK